jgi:hypothetical protein
MWFVRHPVLAIIAGALLLLDGDDMPRVGDAAYGYALNRIPIGQTVTVP